MRKIKLRYILYLVVIIPTVAVIISAAYKWSGVVTPSGSLPYLIYHTLASTAGIWIGVLVIVHYLWQKFPWEHAPIKHLIIEIVLVLLYTNVFSLGLYYINIKLGLLDPVENIPKEIITTNLITLFITTIHEAWEFYRQWKLHFSKSAKLEKDNIEAKYETLKTQINPHFLFNSLNSLTSIVHDNDKAVDYIQDLSEFLRYLLKSRDVELVLLRNEVEMLEKYFALQKSRFGENLLIDMEIPEKYYHYSLPPLVLQMLVENSIKHNIISKDKPLSIDIRATNQSVTVTNNYQKKDIDDSTGQGLKNIIERYKFFTNTDVEIKENKKSFSVTVPLLIVDL